MGEMGSEKVFLSWNKFQTCLVSSYQRLYNSSDFSDVTLVCGDGQKIKAHKIVLASSSNLFGQMLCSDGVISQETAHPLVYMRGISFATLSALMDFVYKGEVEVMSDQVDELLEVATELGLEGLGRREQDKVDVGVGPEQGDLQHHDDSKVVALEGRLEGLADLNSELMEKLPRAPMDEITMSESPKVQFTCDQCDACFNTRGSLKRHVKTHLPSRVEDNYLRTIDVNTEGEGGLSRTERVEYNLGNESDLKNRIQALTSFDSDSGRWSCQECGKHFKYKFNLQRHAEIHIDGLTYTCTICGKNCSQKSKLWNHIARRHPKEQAI